MFWWKKKQAAAATATDPTNPEMSDPMYSPDTGAPQEDLSRLGPIIRQNHVAYFPVREWSRVPGVGTGNLVYAPDYLLTAPAFFGGSGRLRQPNSIRIAQAPAAITHPKTTVEGLGGVTAGQIVHQPLLEVNVSNGNSEVGE
jgi:hypothetical protein